MHITIDLDGYLARILDSAIKKGICKTKAEAVRLGILGLNDKYSVLEEEAYFKELQFRTMRNMWSDKDEIWENYMK